MIDCKMLLENPLVPPNYYFAKVVDIEAEPADYFFPKLLIKLKLHPMYGLDESSIFSAIIYPTDRSFFHYKNFFNTYMLGENVDDLEKAKGSWGSIEIYNTEFGDIEYSGVRFCYQPLDIRMDSWRIEKHEKEAIVSSRYNPE
ncbi:MAG: hypothetical protein GWN00_05245 [Aliifodinibius sp.]|nr:hypothetical protein [Fodinibius sp.]NIV10607.1 hypothetical protein [Fodinibius sp.]NIY24235.1 hypothetical protein [Fodinibius sp.]